MPSMELLVIDRLKQSLLLDLQDKQERSSLEYGDPDAVISLCRDLQRRHIDSSTTHIRARMLENMLTHLQLENELQTLLHKTDVTEADVKRIDDISAVVDKFITQNSY